MAKTPLMRAYWSGVKTGSGGMRFCVGSRGLKGVQSRLLCMGSASQCWNCREVPCHKKGISQAGASCNCFNSSILAFHDCATSGG